MRRLTLALLWLGCARSEPASPPVKVAEVVPAAAPAAGPPDALPARGRPLTANERALVQPIFRDGLDYDSIRVIDGKFMPFQPANVYMAPEGNIYAPGRLYREDFAGPSVDVFTRAVFVHECHHIWQHQSGINLMSGGVAEWIKRGGDYERAYAYTLAAERDLLDYGLEQQASIVEDFHLMKDARERPQRLENRALSAGERERLYGRVLSRFLANARYARNLPQEELARRHESLAAGKPPGAAGCEETQAAHDAQHLCAWRFQDH